MTIDKKFVDQIINVTTKAAISSSHLVGKKDKIAADQAAVDSMRTELNKIEMTGEIVIGEGSLDEAPMLFTGEILGNKNGPKFDIAVDPLEGTNFAANNLPGALSVIAVAEKGNLFKAPETYMHKIATAKVEKGLIDLDYSIKKNIKNLADFKNTVPSKGSTAISNFGPFFLPSISPVNNIGASSRLPSPITISPVISILFNSLLIVSTAA